MDRRITNIALLLGDGLHYGARTVPHTDQEAEAGRLVHEAHKKLILSPLDLHGAKAKLREAEALLPGRASRELLSMQDLALRMLDAKTEASLRPEKPYEVPMDWAEVMGHVIGHALRVLEEVEETGDPESHEEEEAGA